MFLLQRKNIRDLLEINDVTIKFIKIGKTSIKSFDFKKIVFETKFLLGSQLCVEDVLAPHDIRL